MVRPEVGLVIASAKPKELAEFYSFALDAEVRKGVSESHWVIFHPMGTEIQFYRPSDNRPWPKKGRVLAICLKGEPSLEPIKEINKWLLRLIVKGGSVVGQPKAYSFGAEAWILDPEKNQFLLLVPTTQGSKN